MTARVALLVAVAGGLALVAPACADDAAGPSTTARDRGDAPVSTSVDPAEPPDDSGGGAQRVEPRPGMVDVRPHRWESAEPVDGGDAIVVRYYAGVPPCSVLDRVDVAESDAAVTVTLYVGSDPAQPNAVCIEIAALYEVEVTLATPLGGRAIVDGAA